MPRSGGGRNVVDNIEICCLRCNQNSLTPEEFFSRRPKTK
jgi:hypothetical protein